MFWIQVSFRCKGVGGSGCVQMGERDRRKGVMTLSLTNRGGSGSWYPIMDRSVTLLSVLVFQGEGVVLQTVLQREVLQKFGKGG